MRKYIPIITIIAIFICFTIFDSIRKSKFPVLKIIDATEVIVDLNRNKIADNNEYICLKDVKTLTSNLYKNQEDLRNSLNLSYENAIKFGYLADIFADNTLADKEVKLIFDKAQNNPDCRYADIIVNNNSYKEKLLLSGFGFKNGNPSDKFNQLLEKAKKQKLVIFNHKSNKYHKLDCEYGKIANDSVIISLNQIPEYAAPCRFCHVEKNTKRQNIKNKSFPTVISDGSIKLFLTDLTTKLKPDNKCTSIVCKEILEKISQAHSSIDIALYGYDEIPDIHNALQKAKERNVKIRIVYDNSNNSYYPETQQIISLADEKSGDTFKTLMHNKFIIIDNKILVTGSMNFTTTGFSGYNTNSLVIINSKDVANIYKEEFEMMLNGKFSEDKSKKPHKNIEISDSTITTLFSPQDKIITNNLISIIDNSQKYIYMPVFVITHRQLANALINAYKRGVDVKIIVDATGFYSSSSKVKLLRENKIPVKVENYAGKVHSKTIIVDDKYLITGSMNFSYNGENKNDENVLIIKNDKLSIFYKDFFIYLWNKIPDKYLNSGIRAESKDSIGSCYDGIDNNYDGKIDSEDSACK